MTSPTTLTKLTVADVMASPTAVERDAHLAAAAYLMQHAASPVLVVVDDGHHQTPVALLTERDLLRAVAYGGDPAEERVTTWARSSPSSVSPDVTITDVIDLMLDQDTPELPVHDNQHRLVGVIDLISSIRAERSA